jgi:hypothetical protein
VARLVSIQHHGVSVVRGIGGEDLPESSGVLAFLEINGISKDLAKRADPPEKLLQQTLPSLS